MIVPLENATSSAVADHCGFGQVGTEGSTGTAVVTENTTFPFFGIGDDRILPWCDVTRRIRALRIRQPGGVHNDRDVPFAQPRQLPANDELCPGIGERRPLHEMHALGEQDAGGEHRDETDDRASHRRPRIVAPGKTPRCCRNAI